MKPCTGAFPYRIEALDCCSSPRICLYPAAEIMCGRTYWYHILSHINSISQALLIDIGEPFSEILCIHVGHIKINVVCASLLHLYDRKLRYHVPWSKFPVTVI